MSGLLIYWAIKGQANSLTGFFFVCVWIAICMRKKILLKALKDLTANKSIFNRTDTRCIGKGSRKTTISWAVLMYLSPEGHKGLSVSCSVLSRCMPTPTERLSIWTRCTILSPQPMVSPPWQPAELFKQAHYILLQEQGVSSPSCYCKSCLPSLWSFVCHKGNPHVALHSVQCLCPYTHPLDHVTNKLLSISPLQYQSGRCSPIWTILGKGSLSFTHRMGVRKSWDGSSAFSNCSSTPTLLITKWTVGALAANLSISK